MRVKRIDVGVTAKFGAEGGVIPLSVHWRDGREFEVERVLASERAPSHSDARLPIRYICLIREEKRYVYFEPEMLRWFVEVPDFETEI